MPVPLDGIVPSSTGNGYHYESTTSDMQHHLGHTPLMRLSRLPLKQNAPSTDAFVCAAPRSASQTSCRRATEIMQRDGFDQLPIVSSSTGRLAGLVTLGHMLSRISSGRASPDSTVEEVMFHFAASAKHPFAEITVDTPLRDLEAFFEQHSAGIVTERPAGSPTSTAAMLVKHVVTKVDLLSYLMKI